MNVDTKRQYVVREVGTDELYGCHWDDFGEGLEELQDCRRSWQDRKFELVTRTITVSDWTPVQPVATDKSEAGAAAVIREVLDDWPTDLSLRLALMRVAEGMATEFVEANPTFDPVTFLNACGFRQDEL